LGAALVERQVLASLWPTILKGPASLRDFTDAFSFFFVAYGSPRRPSQGSKSLSA
jgi:hypothetical protein